MVAGTGMDIIEVKRFERQWQVGARRFFERLFTEGELAYCRDKACPPMHFAVRFAAKEAFLKALGTGLVAPFSWTEVEVVSTEGGKPELRLSGEVARYVEERRIARWHVSLTHTREMAAAMVVLETDSYGLRS